MSTRVIWATHPKFKCDKNGMNFFDNLFNETKKKLTKIIIKHIIQRQNVANKNN